MDYDPDFGYLGDEVLEAEQARRWADEYTVEAGEEYEYEGLKPSPVRLEKPLSLMKAGKGPEYKKLKAKRDMRSKGKYGDILGEHPHLAGVSSTKKLVMSALNLAGQVETKVKGIMARWRICRSGYVWRSACTIV